jgi:hypothetical protein
LQIAFFIITLAKLSLDLVSIQSGIIEYYCPLCHLQ